MNDLILYTTEDGRSQIKLRAKDQTVWLSQREMAQLFDVSTDNVGLHLKNLYEDGELSRAATTEESSVVQIEGEREVERPVTLHNLDAILAVGYRVRSPRGVQFRRCASTILKEESVCIPDSSISDCVRLKSPRSSSLGEIARQNSPHEPFPGPPMGKISIDCLPVPAAHWRCAVASRSATNCAASRSEALSRRWK